METKRDIGIHLRIKDSYAQVLEEAHSYNIRTCQFFLIPQKSNKYIRLTKKEKELFLSLRNKHFSTVYAHGSYWINPSTGSEKSKEISKELLKKEISIAKQLEINSIVLHAGSAKHFPPNSGDPTHKQEGIQALASFLNKVMKKEETVTILLENTAHANKAIGSNLHDFILLKQLLEQPEKIGFCLDTAHACAYGYNLEATEQFVTLLDQTMGIKNIKLIHLNDSKKACGSKIDAHALPGMGVLGKKVLQNFINHPKIKHIPIIVEPPALIEEATQSFLDDLKTW